MLADAKKTEQRLTEVLDQVNGIADGFLDQLRIEACQRLAKTVLTCEERLMSFLEQLDAVQLEHTEQRLRDYRKQVVNEIGRLLTLTDTLSDQIAHLASGK